MSRRFLAVVLPLLPIERLRRQDPVLRDRPLATWTTTGNRRLIVAAAAPGIAPDQALADAQALCPTLVLRPADPEADAALLEQLALWCLRWTPLVAVNGRDGLWLDITGCSDLFGGEAALLQQVRAGLLRAGFASRAAIASSAEAAAALAQALDGVIVPPGQDLAAVRPLPLTALRLPLEVSSGLSLLGVQTVGDALRQPRAPLSRRFGRVLLDALDGVSGARTRPLQPVRAPAPFLAIRECLEPILTRPAIEQVLEALLRQVCQQLRQAGRGARRLVLRAWRVDGRVQEVAIGTGAASREVAHLRRLFAEPLGQLEPDLGFERFSLEAPATDPLEGVQALIRGERLGAAEGHASGLAALLDRLGQRVTVSRPQPLDSHWPEYAVVPTAPFESIAVPADWGREPRPLRLLAQPLALTVVAAAADGLPLQLRHGRSVYHVLQALGPERLEPEWWGEDATRPARDYYRVQTVEGPRLWICRLLEPGAEGAARWFLHGELA
jgi:protein ImuB